MLSANMVTTLQVCRRVSSQVRGYSKTVQSYARRAHLNQASSKKGKDSVGNGIRKKGDEALCSKLTILGGGKMAEAIINALHSKKSLPMSSIHVYDVNEDRLNYLSKNFKVQVSDDCNKAVEGAELVILAVKPQHVTYVSKALTKPLTGVLLSIVAGCTMQTLRSEFNTSLVVRSMPNTPAMVLEGITVWAAAKEIPSEMNQKVRELLCSLGDEVEVSDETYLDMATAVSGSGPAYVFLTMEAMTDAAVHLGFPRDVATKLVTATIKGSAIYSQQSGETLTTLRNNVTSPGGTTASALYELERGGFRTTVSNGIWAAYRRALELGGNNPNVGPDRNKFNSTK